MLRFQEKVALKEIELQVLQSLATVGHSQKLGYLLKRCVKAEYQSRNVLSFLMMITEDFVHNCIRRPIQKIKNIFARRIKFKFNRLVDHELVSGLVMLLILIKLFYSLISRATVMNSDSASIRFTLQLTLMQAFYTFWWKHIWVHLIFFGLSSFGL